jgi:antitoxin HicB
MRLAYPMRFTPEPGEPGVYNVQAIEPMGGVITFGESLEEAKAMARDALTGVLASMLDHGEPVPPPPHAEGDDIYWIEPEPEVAVPLLLRWARQEANVTQAELAARMKMTQQAVQKLERAGANPSVKTLAKVAKALGRELQIAI